MKPTPSPFPASRLVGPPRRRHGLQRATWRGGICLNLRQKWQICDKLTKSPACLSQIQKPRLSQISGRSDGSQSAAGASTTGSATLSADSHGWWTSTVDLELPFGAPSVSQIQFFGIHPNLRHNQRICDKTGQPNIPCRRFDVRSCRRFSDDKVAPRASHERS